MTQPILWSGNRSLGSREAGEETIARVRAYIEVLRGKSAARHASDICFDLDIGGRELRAALAELDGSIGNDHEPLIITSGDAGIFRAEFAEEAMEGTRRFEAQARRMLERVARREQLTEDLPRLQGTLL